MNDDMLSPSEIEALLKGDFSGENQENDLDEVSIPAERAEQLANQLPPTQKEAELSRTPAYSSKEPLHKSEGTSAHIETAVFSSFQPQPPVNEKETRNLNMLFDIPLQVTVELGRTSRNVKEILELTAGSIIELDKLAGEPVDVLINNKLVAKGEVVVIDESFGVRITTIASPTDRLKNIN